MNLNQKLVAIDGVFFQLQTTGICRVWKSLLAEWADTEFSRCLVVLDRVGTAPKIAGITYYSIPAYNYHNLEADRVMLQQVCDKLNVELFISTFTTTPVSTPSIFVAYDLIPEMWGRDLNPLLLRSKQQAINYASSFIAISQQTAMDLIRYYPIVNPSAVTVAYCGVSAEFKPASGDRVQEWCQTHQINKPYFLLVGTGSSYKNTVLFWQALAQMPDRVKYAVVCTGTANLAAVSLHVKYAPNCKVYYLQLGDAELALAYAGAIALIYPSKYEGFGLPIVEALACGCHVITCRNGSIPEVAGACALYVNATSIAQMYDALVSVQRADIREPLITAGLIQSRKFSWSKMANTIRTHIKKYA